MLLSRLSDAELLDDSETPSESFAAFYRRHVDAVLGFVTGNGADREMAADVVAETFFVALRQRARYRPDHPTARQWLLGIAVRRLADARRYEERERRRLARFAEHVLARAYAERDRFALLIEHLDAMEAVRRLPRQEREVLVARLVEERSYAEIADALGLSEAAARKRASRGLERLRARLGEA